MYSGVAKSLREMRVERGLRFRSAKFYRNYFKTIIADNFATAAAIKQQKKLRAMTSVNDEIAKHEGYSHDYTRS